MAVNQKVAVVTGGGGVIGTAICVAMAQAGMHVVVVDIDKAHANACVEELRNMCFEPHVAVGDLCDKSQVMRIKQEVESKLGRVDVLVHSHGDNKNELLFKIEETTWKRTLAVHLEGTLHCMLAFGSIMKERRFGRIINMSSIGAGGAIAGAAYAAAKSGIEALSKVAAMEWARYGITVNCLAPGLIGGEGSMFNRTTPEDFKKNMVKRTPLKRTGTPEEVAAVARFLASDEAGFITGQVIHVDGGLSLGSLSV